MGKLEIMDYVLCSWHHVKHWESRDEHSPCPVPSQLSSLWTLNRGLTLSPLRHRRPMGAWTPAGSRVLKLAGQKESENTPDHPVTAWQSSLEKALEEEGLDQGNQLMKMLQSLGGGKDAFIRHEPCGLEREIILSQFRHQQNHDNGTNLSRCHKDWTGSNQTVHVSEDNNESSISFSYYYNYHKAQSRSESLVVFLPSTFL